VEHQTPASKSIPTCATRDVVAKLLLDPSWSGQDHVPVLGPEDLSFNDMAQGMLDMAAAKNDGLDNAEPRTPESKTPTSFRQWCEKVLKPAVLS
jgi:hypothetical protein